MKHEKINLKYGDSITIDRPSGPTLNGTVRKQYIQMEEGDFGDVILYAGLSDSESLALRQKAFGYGPRPDKILGYHKEDYAALTRFIKHLAKLLKSNGWTLYINSEKVYIDDPVSADTPVEAPKRNRGPVKLDNELFSIEFTSLSFNL